MFDDVPEEVPAESCSEVLRLEFPEHLSPRNKREQTQSDCEFVLRFYSWDYFCSFKATLQFLFL